MTDIENIRKAIKEEKAVIGTKSIIKELKLGKLSKVYVTINCPKNIKEDVKRYADISGAEVIEINQPNDELGILCKKPFSISLLGIKV